MSYVEFLDNSVQISQSEYAELKAKAAALDRLQKYIDFGSPHYISICAGKVQFATSHEMKVVDLHKSSLIEFLNNLPEDK